MPNVRCNLFQNGKIISQPSVSFEDDAHGMRWGKFPKSPGTWRVGTSTDYALQYGTGPQVPIITMWANGGIMFWSVAEKWNCPLDVMTDDV